MYNRRALLTGVSAVGTVTIAGCSSGNESGSNTTSGDSESSTSGDNSGGSDGSSGDDSSTGDGEGGSSDGEEDSTTSLTPEGVVRQFWEAIIEGNYEIANELLHPGSLNYPLDESDVSLSDGEIETVEEVTYDEASDRVAIASKEDFDDAIEEATGATDYMLVYITIADSDGITPVVEDDGELLTVYLR